MAEDSAGIRTDEFSQEIPRIEYIRQIFLILMDDPNQRSDNKAI